MVKICALGKDQFRIVYYDGIERLYMNSQIALMLDLGVDQLNEMLSEKGAIEDDGSYYFTNIDDVRMAREELENIIVLNKIIGFKF